MGEKRMMPQLRACYFGQDGPFHRMAHVLAYSAYQHCPTWDIEVRHISPRPLVSALGIASHVHNTQKMEYWADAVAAAPDGACLLLIDADTVILQPLDDIWHQPFDVAYTTKQSRFPFNSGVVLVRVSPASRRFIETWRGENLRMLGDRLHHQEWRKRYGGINQASLGYALEHQLTKHLRLLELPCVEWNCEDSAWRDFSPTRTRIVHVKSALRRAIFQMTVTDEAVRPLIKLWQDLEAKTVSQKSRVAR
jgi:hypothetical protein